MPSCCVKTCPNRNGFAGVTFHKVPFKMKETWYKILSKHGMKNMSIHMVVCSDHFKSQDLDRDGFRSVLKKGAVPCLYLDRPKPESDDHVDLRQAHNSLVRVLKRGMKMHKGMNKLKNTQPPQPSDAKDQEKLDKKAAAYLKKLKNRAKNQSASSSRYNYEIRYLSSTSSASSSVTAENGVNNPTWFSEQEIKIVDVQSILRSRCIQ